jgi:beta-galactosidase
MEQQPGPVNWAQFNPDPTRYATAVGLGGFAFGAEVVSTGVRRLWARADARRLLRPDSEPVQSPRRDAGRPELKAIADRVGSVTIRRGRYHDYQSEWPGTFNPATKARHGAHSGAVCCVPPTASTRLLPRPQALPVMT